MKIVVALGGNALLRRTEVASAENQLVNVRLAATQLARLAEAHSVVLTHGNGPQVGLLALQAAAYTDVPGYPLDVLGAETEGMIGYLLEQEIANRLPEGRVVATLLTRVEVDPRDPAFERPTKPIGPVYSQSDGQRMADDKGWTLAADGKGLRRVVASPQPLRLLSLAPIRWLLSQGALVIAAGGGGIPVARGDDGHSMHGVDAVIDKDSCSSLLACELEADCLVIVTDVAAAYVDWGLPSPRALGRVTPDELERHAWLAGSMGPKVAAACRFVRTTGGRAVIGALNDIQALVAGGAGTQVSNRPQGMPGQPKV